MKLRHIVLAFALLSAAPWTIAQTSGGAAVVKTENGQLSGATDAQGVTAFLGIPYAEPPVGALRWRPPQPAKPWRGVRSATEFGNSCLQVKQGARLPWTAPFMVQNDISEDCLYLNVWSAAAGTSRKLPVLFWIHGGGNSEGSGAVAAYNGASLAHKGVVLVTINYRLGPLGFLAHPALTAESPRHVSGNYGLLDQIAALQWVHKNIAAFGGDPSRVTVFGQSAGAGDTTALMQSSLARGLFAHAITESGSGRTAMPARHTSLAQAEQRGVQYATTMGAHSLEELRALPAEDFSKPLPGVPASSLGFGPVTDNWVLPESLPTQSVPLMNGMVANDLGIGINYGSGDEPPVVTLDQYGSQIKTLCGNEAATCLKLYPAQDDAQADDALLTILRDRARVSIYLWSVDQSKRGPVYSYYFDRAEPWPEHPRFGAFHTSEVPYVFETLDKIGHPFTADDRRVADQVSSYWIDFATSGDPNGAGLPHWPKFNADSPTTMELGLRMGPMPIASNADRQAFWLKFLKH